MAVRLVHVDDHAAAVAVHAGLGEGLQQALADPLAGHLDQAERGDLGHLVLGPVPAQALQQAAQHQVTVGLQHHVDEVDHDDAAEVAQPQLADDLLGRLDVVAGDGLLEVAALADELAGVDVDDDHRLGPVDHQRTAGGQPDLAVQRLHQLLVDPVRGEHVDVRGPPLQALGEVGGDVGDVVVDGAPGVGAADDDLGEVLVEDVADHPNRHVGLAVEQRRGVAGGGLLLDLLPLLLEALDVAGQLLLGGALGGGADDHARVVRDDLLEDLLEAGPLVLRQLAGDAGHRALGHVHQVAAGQRDLAGQAGALVADRVLGDLDQHGLAGLQHRLDPARAAVSAERAEVDLAGVQHGVAALADVDERGLHRRQHVLDLAQVHVADVAGGLLLVDVVLDEHAVLEHADLGAGAGLAHHHDPLDGLAAGQELGLGDDRDAAAAQLAALAAALLLGLQAGGALDGLHLVRVERGLGGAAPRLADLHHGAHAVLGGLALLGALAAAAATATAAARGGQAGGQVVLAVVLALVVGVLGLGLLVGVLGVGLDGLGALGGLVGVLGVTTAAATAAPAAAAGRTAVLLPLRLLLRAGGGRLDLGRGLDLHGLGGLGGLLDGLGRLGGLRGGLPGLGALPGLLDAHRGAHPAAAADAAVLELVVLGLVLRGDGLGRLGLGGGRGLGGRGLRGGSGCGGLLEHRGLEDRGGGADGTAAGARRLGGHGLLDGRLGRGLLDGLLGGGLLGHRLLDRRGALGGRGDALARPAGPSGLLLRDRLDDRLGRGLLGHRLGGGGGGDLRRAGRGLGALAGAPGPDGLLGGRLGRGLGGRRLLGARRGGDDGLGTLAGGTLRGAGRAGDRPATAARRGGGGAVVGVVGRSGLRFGVFEHAGVSPVRPPGSASGHDVPPLSPAGRACSGGSGSHGAVVRTRGRTGARSLARPPHGAGSRKVFWSDQSSQFSRAGPRVAGPAH